VIRCKLDICHKKFFIPVSGRSPYLRWMDIATISKIQSANRQNWYLTE
jgi:hypothetical protein